MRGVAWLCEISLTPAWPQYAGIPHPTRPPASSPAPGGGGSRGDTRGKAVPGRANPHTSSFFRFSPYPGPWGIYTRGGGADGAGASLLSPGGVAPGEPEEHPPRISRMQGDMVQWFGAQRSLSLQKKSHKRVESSSESSSTSSKQASPPSRRRGALPQSTSSGTS